MAFLCRLRHSPFPCWSCIVIVMYHFPSTHSFGRTTYSRALSHWYFYGNIVSRMNSALASLRVASSTDPTVVSRKCISVSRKCISVEYFLNVNKVVKLIQQACTWQLYCKRISSSLQADCISDMKEYMNNLASDLNFSEQTHLRLHDL